MGTAEKTVNDIRERGRPCPGQLSSMRSSCPCSRGSNFISPVGLALTLPLQLQCFPPRQESRPKTSIPNYGQFTGWKFRPCRRVCRL
jgi:hypothetical protein